MNSNTYLLYLVVILLTSVISIEAHTQIKCVELVSSRHTTQQKSRTTNDPLVVAKEMMNTVEFQKFKMWYLSHFFFNKDVLLEHQFNSNGFIYPQVYNKNEENPFLSYLIARDHIFSISIKKVLTIEGIQDAHRALLKKYPAHQNQYLGESSLQNSENTLDSDLGIIRKNGVLSVNDLHRQVKRPLTHYTDPNDYSIPSPKNETELFQENPFLSSYKNKIDHADLIHWKMFEDRLSTQLISKLNANRDSENPELIQEYVTELLKYTLKLVKNDVHRNRDSVADFIHEFISIHPFNNGNGRLARLLAERILYEWRLPSPLWTHYGIDITLSKPEFREVLSNSIDQSDNFNSLLFNSLKQNNLQFQKQISPFLLPMKLLKEHSPDPSEITQNLNLDEFQKFKRYCKNCKSDRDAIKRYIDWSIKFSRLNSNDKAKVSFIPDDFIEEFGDLTKPLNPNHYYKNKMGSTINLHRGFATPKYLTVDDVIKFFINPNPELVGMGVRPSVSKVKESLLYFNDKLTHASQFINNAAEHWKGESKYYWISQLSSWSSALRLSSSFADFQYIDSKVGSAVVVTALRPKYGVIDAVEFDSSHNLDLGFSEEKEFSIAGGTDPRSIYQVHVKTAHFNNYLWGHKEKDRAYTATRLGHNEIKIVVSSPVIPQHNAYSDPTLLRSSEWRLESEYHVTLFSDGQYKIKKIN